MNEHLHTADDTPDRHLPWYVPLFGPIAKLLLRIGVPLGANRLVTIRGRKSGRPLTTPIAVIEASGRRWIWAPWGEVQWVQNLRESGLATIDVRDGNEVVAAIELDHAGRVRFFRDILGPVARSMRGGTWFIRTVDGVDLADPVEAAEGRPVFELHRIW